MITRVRAIALSAFVIANALALPARESQAQVAPSAGAPATLAGVVRDSAGNGLRDVEVLIRGTTHATRTNENGEFTLAGVAPGTYRAFFRRLGFQSVEYNWQPDPGERTEVSVGLEPIAQNLDPVVVRADEDKRFSAHASIQGIVVDSAGNPIPEAEVNVIGSGGAGMTRANGGFLFKPLAIGTYVIRVRKFGYSPATLTVELHQDDDRELYIRMQPLAVGLDPVVVYGQSGLGKNAAWDDFEKRRRWVDASSQIIGPDALRKFGSLGLDDVAKSTLLPMTDGSQQRTPARFRPGAMQSGMSSYSMAGDACVLLNGTFAMQQPLGMFRADEIELVEIYPVNTELTGTVSKRFTSPMCAPLSILRHPTYFVVWLKGSKPK